jgi:hypothetical protein
MSRNVSELCYSHAKVSLPPADRTKMRFLAVLLLLAMGGVAHADYPLPYADLLCDHNVALARFAMADERDPQQYAILPPKLDDGLSSRRGTGRTDCRLADGSDIRIRAGEEQAFPYGAGGADPPAFFSLWIGHRKILSKRVWKPGYDDSILNKPGLVGLVIRPHSLTFCYRQPDDKEVRCERQRLELSKHAVDAEEYPGPSAQKPPVGTILIEPASADAAACQRYLDAVISDAKRPRDGFPFFNGLPETALSQQITAGNYALSALDGTFANIGDRRVVATGSTGHYFDGDIFFLVPHDTPTDEIVAAVPGEDVDEAIDKLKRDGWTVISGGRPGLYPRVPPRYVHLVPEALDSELFFLAYPTNQKERPTAILIKPLPGGGFATLCNYQRVEPHY